jgi:hypothetical protein
LIPTTYHSRENAMQENLDRAQIRALGQKEVDVDAAKAKAAAQVATYITSISHATAMRLVELIHSRAIDALRLDI